jgi:outer membrane immunogenic protein
MRRILLGAIIAGAFAGPGLAADLPAAMPAKAPAYVPAFSWTGTYVGVNLGGVWSNFDYDPITTVNVSGFGSAIPRTSSSANSFIGGGQAGYNWQLGSIVLGFEQDFQFTGLKSSFTYAAAPGGALVAGDGFSTKYDYLGATRAKIGFAWDRVMLYAAGGVETAVVDSTGNYVARAGGSPAAAFTDADKFYWGWTIGGGLEYAMTNNVFLGFDYRYFDLGGQTFNLGAVTPGAGLTSTVAVSEHLRGSEALARLNIKLNGLGFFGM